MLTATVIPIPVLAIGTMLKVEGFARAYPLNGVRADSVRYGRDPEAAWARALENNHDTAWAINVGSALTDEPIERKRAKLAQERAEFEDATVVRSGGAYVVEGVLQRCTVHGERFSDCIVFKPI